MEKEIAGTIKFRINSGKGSGEVIKNNKHMILVRLEDGNIIKRHKIKHNVIYN